MPAPDWLTYTTLAASIAAAGGAGWAISTTRIHLTRETRRARELRTLRSELTHDADRTTIESSLVRDQVTERYQELSVALSNFGTVWAEAVHQRTTPAADNTLPPGSDVVVSRLDVVHRELLRVATITIVVARPRVAPLLELLLSLDLRVLAPFSAPGAPPAPAVERLNREHGFLIEIQRLLREAMRADLGLLEANELGLLIMDTKRVLDTLSPAQRSIGAGGTERNLLDYLGAFGVRVLAGGDAQDFTMDAETFVFFQSKDPALAGNLEAILALYGPDVSLAVHADLTEDARLPLLQRVVASLECGFRDREGITLDDGTTVYAFRPGV